MANGNDWPSKVLKKVFQNRQGSDIQVIGWLIEKKNIGFSIKSFKRKRRFFSPPESFRSRFRAWNVGREIAQEISNRSRPNGRSSLLQQLPEEINHALALIQTINLLRNKPPARFSPIMTCPD